MSSKNRPLTPQEISASIEIPGRKMEFDYKFEDLPRYWNDNDAFKTTFLSALSCLFPEGERMFMDSVRHYKDRIKDPVLQKQIQGFIKQEAMHGHEHSQFNDFLNHLGYPASKVENFQHKERMWMQKYIPWKHLLATTCALEHFTAILAHNVLTDPKSTEGMDERFKELWVWHSIEETEHKAVAFDVYQEVCGSYGVRAFNMIIVTLMFLMRTSIIQAIFLWKDGKLFSPKTWWQGFKFYFLKPGVVRKIFKDYIEYFSPNFHPWQQDNRELLQKWLAEHDNYKTI